MDCFQAMPKGVVKLHLLQLTFLPPAAHQAERPLGGSQRELHPFG